MTILVSGVEACKRLGVSRTTFDKLRKAGTIPPPVAGTTKYVWTGVLAAVTAAPAETDRAPEAQPMGRQE